MASKKLNEENVAAAAEHIRRLIDKGRRQALSLAYFRQMEALLAYLDTVRGHECLTVGNGNPKPYHCFSCTWNHLHDEVRKAVEFWGKQEIRDGALS